MEEIINARYDKVVRDLDNITQIIEFLLKKQKELQKELNVIIAEQRKQELATCENKMVEEMIMEQEDAGYHQQKYQNTTDTEEVKQQEDYSVEELLEIANREEIRKMMDDPELIKDLPDLKLRMTYCYLYVYKYKDVVMEKLQISRATLFNRIAIIKKTRPEIDGFIERGFANK